MGVPFKSRANDAVRVQASSLWVIGVFLLAGCVQPPADMDDGDQPPVAATTPAGGPPAPDDATDPEAAEGESQDMHGTLQHDGRTRAYRLHLPAASGPLPLLVVLHGGGSNAAAAQATFGIDAAADAAGVAVLYPDGDAPAQRPNWRTWHAVHCCEPALTFGTDDRGFLDALLANITGSHDIDADRIGLAGHSNGAMMALMYGAERSAMIASIVSVAGTIGGQRSQGAPVERIADPDHPVSVAFVHATDDGHVPYHGGHGPDAVDPDRVDLSVADGAAFWRDANGLDGASRTWTQDGVQYEAWGDAVEVVVATTHGGHGWPGGSGSFPGPEDPDAGAFAVRFLMEHPRTQTF